MSSALRLVLRILAAVGVLAGGALHLRIWDEDYREIPDGAVPGLWVVQDGFPVNAGLSLLLAIGVLVFARRPIVWLAALMLQLGSIIALVLSREASIFGWKEPDWSSDAKTVLLVEVATSAVLVLLLALDFLHSEKRTAVTGSVSGGGW